MIKKKGYFEYNPQIYPRRLWVMYDTSEEEIDKCFTDKYGNPLDHGDEPMSNGSYGGAVYDECVSKAGGYLGNLVVFPKRRDMTLRNVSHEALHTLLSIYDVCGLELVPKGKNEHLTYLMGWISDCIDNARLGVGDFVEIKDKEE